MSSKPKKEKKKDKKKNLLVKKEKKDAKDQQKPNKSDILSKLDELDSFSEEETRATEEILRKGLTESKSTETEEDSKKIEINISNIKNEIEKLKDIKQKYYDNGENDKTLEISKKIIDLATKHNMAFAATEEKKFFDQLQNKINDSSTKLIRENIDNLKKIRHNHYTQERYDNAILVSKQIIDLAIKDSLIAIKKEEEKWLSLMQDKIEAQTSELNRLEALKLKIAKQSQINQDIVEEKANIEFDNKKLVSNNITTNSKQKSEVITKEFKAVKDEFEEEKLKFEEEKLKFQEEKELLKWERQMIEEVKLRFEQDKLKDNEIVGEIKLDSESTMNENIEKDREEKLIIGEQKKLLEQEKKNFLVMGEQFKQLRMKFEEEKKVFDQKVAKFEEEKEILNEKKLNFEEEREKFKEEKLNLEEQKKIFEENWLNFEEEKIKLKQEQEQFGEQKKLFKWEQQMFEELKNYEKEND